METAPHTFLLWLAHVWRGPPWLWDTRGSCLCQRPWSWGWLRGRKGQETRAATGHQDLFSSQRVIKSRTPIGNS